MLPNEAAKQHWQATFKKSVKTLQSTVTDQFKPEDAATKPIPYSDKAFVSAAIKWLIDADLVSAFLPSSSE